MIDRPQFSVNEALIAWNPGTDQIAVGPLIDPEEGHDWTVRPVRYQYTGGAAHMEVRKLTGGAACIYVLNLFNTLVIRDCMEPRAVHTALCKIREFAESINLECPGAVESTTAEPKTTI